MSTVEKRFGKRINLNEPWSVECTKLGARVAEDDDNDDEEGEGGRDDDDDDDNNNNDDDDDYDEIKAAKDMRRIGKGHNTRGAAFFTKWDLEANDDEDDEWEMPPDLKGKGDSEEEEGSEGEGNYSEDIISEEEEEEEEEDNRDIEIIKQAF